MCRYRMAGVAAGRVAPGMMMKPPDVAQFAGHVSKVCLKSVLIYPVAWCSYIYAMLSLPVNVTVAFTRTLAGVGGRGVDELLASFLLPGGVAAAESDKLLLQGLRGKHGAAVGALRDQLDDSESRYKVRAAAGRRSRFFSGFFQTNTQLAGTRT